MRHEDVTDGNCWACGNSGDSSTADLATGALSNLAQHESWRARMQMMDMLNTFTLGN